MIKKILEAMSKQQNEQRQVDAYRELIHKEAVIGGQLFGPLPPAHRREFFCLDEHTWIWHEEWADQTGQLKSRTTRYDVRPSGILKSQDGNSSYRAVTKVEARHLIEAAKLYEQKVRSDVYGTES